MKTIEQKAKAYDKAIKVAADIKAGTATYITDGTPVVDAIFPELKESEDERIRKKLIDYFKGFLDDYEDTYKVGGGVTWEGLDVKNVLSWLEKHGEQKVSYTTLVETGNGGINALVTRELPINDCGEQKPTDKIEPKFKVGDWIIKENYSAQQVIELREESYILDGSISGIETLPKKYVENNYHLWTIQDAKAGDVLIDNYKNIVFVLYQEPYSNLVYHSFCFASTKVFVASGGSHFIKGTCPATKEQRDTLLKEMTDAGYTFDFEKKELKKIEHDVQLTEFEDALKDMMNDYRDAIGDNDVTIEEVKNHAAYMLSLIHQKPAWSEEDENHVKSILSTIECCKAQFLNSPAVVEAYNADVEWLKSIKGRMQPKQEWSEEDERMLENIIFELEENQENISGVGYKIDWLKSLRPQNTWKPSDEQILQTIGRNDFYADYYNLDKWDGKFNG